ncbi:SapC family protein [Massilia sp. H-1]|nr:SapC family protein [Massilia sp. H-1]
MAVEFPQAAPEYAIVFAKNNDDVVPVVILGARQNENLFLTGDDSWEGSYVPAFIRRYPFVFSISEDNKTFTLCVDEAFQGLNYQGRGEALFTADGKHTPYVDNVLKFLQEYRVQFQRTQAFCKKLKELDLLEPMQAEFTLASGEKMSLAGFQAVDRKRLKALSGDQLHEMAANDELELIYLHLQSMRNFSSVKDRLVGQQERAAKAGAPSSTGSGSHGHHHRNGALTAPTSERSGHLSWHDGVGSEAIYSQADGARTREESTAWDQFASDASTTGFCTSWLAILCSQVEQCNGALLVLGPDPGGGYGAAAVWPDKGRNMQYLGAAAERALNERRGFVENVLKERRRVANRVITERRKITHQRDGGLKASFVAYPIEVAGRLHGAVVLDIAHSPAHKLQQALRLVHWASAWLVDRFRQQLFLEQQAHSGRMAAVSDLVATALQEPRTGACALAVANELAARLGCERVSVGTEKRGSVVVQAISHTAVFDKRSDLVRLVGEAMDEVLDLDMALLHPPLDVDAVGGLAQAALSAARSDCAVMSVPLINHSAVIGAITLGTRPRATV